jgi:hypothetical protein
MAMIFIMALAFMLANVSAVIGDPTSSCGHRAALCRVPLVTHEASTTDRWKIAVLCCCKTHSGGECCVQVAQCGGKPPGCFCASPTVPATPPAAHDNSPTTTAVTSIRNTVATSALFKALVGKCRTH